MNEVKVIYLIGGRHFYSKEKNKDYYTLDFLLTSESGDSVLFKQFVNEDTFKSAQRLLDKDTMCYIPNSNLINYISNGSLFTRINIDENL